MVPEITRILQDLLQLIEKNGEFGIFIGLVLSVLALYLTFCFVKCVWRVLAHFFLRFSKKYVLN